MALLTTKATAAAITALLQEGARAPSRQGFTPQTRFTKKLHPWKVRYSTARKAYLVYIPEGSVAGVTLDLSDLTEDEKISNWYVLDQSEFLIQTEAVMYLYGNKVRFAPPDEHDQNAEKPSFQCLIAKITDATGTRPSKIVVKQIVSSTISLGGGGTYYAAGPVKIEVVEEEPYLVQRWVLISGSEMTEVDDEGIPDGDTTPRMPGGMNADAIYATKVPLVTHATDHASGVVIQEA